MRKANNQSGFGIIEIIIVAVVLAVVGFIAWRVLSPSNPGPYGSGPGFVEWSFDGSKWNPNGTAPACESPLAIASPADVTKMSAVLMPGQVRGCDFKPHGGLSSADPYYNDVTVSTVRDAYLYRGARYIAQDDGGETQVQYMFDFMDSCGVMFRLDHLADLTDQFKAYADRLAEPKPEDSRTSMFDDHPFIPKGTIVATAIGIKASKNSFFDFGVYDLRQPNEASKTDLYKTDSLRISDKEQSFFAVCWFDLLQGNDKQVVAGLPQRNGSPQGDSDYCK
jgi:hypothetical protein